MPSGLWSYGSRAERRAARAGEGKGRGFTKPPLKRGKRKRRR